MGLTTDELLARMQTLLWFNSVWHARALGSKGFSRGATPREAMLAALGMSDEPVELNADLF